jgi:hypothetical protein
VQQLAVLPADCPLGLRVTALLWSLYHSYSVTIRDKVAVPLVVAPQRTCSGLPSHSSAALMETRASIRQEVSVAARGYSPAIPIFAALPTRPVAISGSAVQPLVIPALPLAGLFAARTMRIVCRGSAVRLVTPSSTEHAVRRQISVVTPAATARQISLSLATVRMQR